MAEVSMDKVGKGAFEPSVEVYEQSDGQWGWRLIGSNGEPMCRGEGHRDKWDAARAAETVEEVFKRDPKVVLLRQPGEKF